MPPRHQAYATECRFGIGAACLAVPLRRLTDTQLRAAQGDFAPREGSAAPLWRGDLHPLRHVPIHQGGAPVPAPVRRRFESSQPDSSSRTMRRMRT